MTTRLFLVNYRRFGEGNSMGYRRNRGGIKHSLEAILERLKGMYDLRRRAARKAKDRGQTKDEGRRINDGTGE